MRVVVNSQFVQLEDDCAFRVCSDVLHGWQLDMHMGVFDGPTSADSPRAILADVHVLLTHPVGLDFDPTILKHSRQIGNRAVHCFARERKLHEELERGKALEVERKARLREQELKLQDEHEARLREQELKLQDEHEARLRKQELKIEEGRAAHARELQRGLEGLVEGSGLNGNAVWPLHMILAGMHTGDSPDEIGTELWVDPEVVQAVQATFGWTVSFSRAMQEGGAAMRAWFTNLGIDVEQLESQYQCLDQESEARLLCGAAVEATGMRGVSRVRSMYRYHGQEVGPVHSATTSLLVHAPVFSPAAAGPAKNSFEWKPLRTAHGSEVSIPLVMPQLYGNRPALVVGQSAVCYHIPLVLSAPRILLAVRVAECFQGLSMGVQLTGVHGSGKSVFLKALANILPSGYPADVFLSSNADLLRRAPAGAGRVFATSSGPLVDPRLSESKLCAGADEPGDFSLRVHQQVAQREWANGNLHDATEHKSLQRTVADFLGRDSGGNRAVCIAQGLFNLFQHDQVPERSKLAKVLILDEVNVLLKELSVLSPTQSVDESSRLWRSSIKWHSSPLGRTVQILAASPDGVREKVHERDDRHPFYELRPTRSDHLASVLAAAPDFIFPVEHEGTATIVSRSAKQAELHNAIEVCRELCGNMRYVATYASQMAAESATAKTAHATVLAEALNKYVGVLAARLGNREATDVPNRHTGDFDPLLRLAAQNASMVVREHADKEDGDSDLVGFAAIHVLRRYLQTDPRFFQRFSHRQQRQLASLFVSDAADELSGAQFENEIETRLMLQAVSCRWWRMDQLADMAVGLRWPRRGSDASATAGMQHLARLHKKHDFFVQAPTGMVGHECEHISKAAQVHPALWTKFAKGLSASGPMQRMLSSRAGQNSRVDAEVPQAAERCARAKASLLIRTAPTFPGVDFVLLHCDQESGAKTVIFCETTVSQLKKHAQASAGPNVPQALRDIHQLTVDTFPWSRNAATGEHWISTRTDTSRPEGEHWTQEEPTSIANMWLSVLGCPRRISGSLEGSGDRAQVRVKLQPGSATSAIDFDQWDVKVVYISAAVEQLSTYNELAALESDMVYSVNGLDLNQACAAWVQPDQAKRLGHERS